MGGGCFGGYFDRFWGLGRVEEACVKQLMLIGLCVVEGEGWVCYMMDGTC